MASRDTEDIMLEGVRVEAPMEALVTREELQKKLWKAIKEKDEDSFRYHLSGLHQLLKDDNRMKELLDGSLAYAAYTGFQPAVETLIQKSGDVNAMSAVPEDLKFPDWKMTPLHWAAEKGHVDTVRCLVENRADINIKEDALGCTSLHSVTREDHVDVVRYVVQQDVDINIKDEDGLTPLHFAAEAGHVDIARCLVENDAHLNIKDENGWTPLHFAAYLGHVDIVRCLVEHSADPNIKDHRDGWTPLLIAARLGHMNIVRCLVQHGADPNIKDNRGHTPLLSAADAGRVDIVGCLVEHSAHPSIKDDRDGWTPLHTASREGHVNIVRCLVEHGADPNIKDNRGWTPLLIAARLGHMNTVRCLVEHGADPNIKNNHGSTPLLIAAREGHVNIVTCLVEHGAHPNIKDDSEQNRYGRTPLHWVCARGDVETVKHLLQKGADPTAKDKDGQTPLSAAIYSRHKDVAAILLEQEKWEEILRSSDEEYTTPMRGLIAFMPDVAERAFSKCVTTNKGKGESWGEEVHADSRKLEVEFNYEFLEDFQDEQSPDKLSSGEEGATNIDTSAKSWQPKKFTKHSHPLFLIKKHGCSNLMKHPLVISLLDYKWKKFGRYIFFGNLLIYLIFLVFLTAFGLVVLSPVERPCTEVLNGSFNGTTPENCGDLNIDEYQFLFIGAAFTIATALLRLVVEVIQLYRHPVEYLQDWVNWLEIPLYLCSMIFTFVFATPCLCVYNWQWQIGVVAVFLSWIGLISFLQKWPVTGVYILMFINIIQSFLKITFLALLLVIAFALAFYMLFFEPDEVRNAFSHPGRAIVKVMTMTTGELDYDEIFHQQEGEEEIAFPSVSFILWVIFLVLIPVLLNNLLVGLAVGDVDSRLKSAFENRIELQIDLVLTCEELLKSRAIKKLCGCLHIHHSFVIQKSRRIYPNTPETLLPQWCKRDGDAAWFGNDVDRYLAYNPGDRMSDRARQWIAKRYAKWWITDDYSTSGVNICNKIVPPQDPTEKQLQQQSDQLVKLQQQIGEQKKKLDAKLQQLSERSEEQLKEQAAEMKDQTRQLAATLREELKAKFQQKFQEPIKQLSEDQTKKSEVQAKEMSWQMGQLAGEVVTSREQLQQQLQEAIKLSEEQAQKSEKQAKEMNEQKGQLAAIKQLTEEQTQKSEEQTKEIKEQTAQLAAEVATLREALQKLITKMDV